MKKSYFNLDVFKEINVILMDKLIKNYKNLKYLNLVSKFHRYKNKSKKALSKKYLKKEILIIEYLSKLYLNKFKFHTYLPGLKNTLSKIYNKKIKLNLINLKYLQLNSDMFSEAISIKLRKRTKSLYKLLRKSFNLVKTLKPNEEYINSWGDSVREAMHKRGLLYFQDVLCQVKARLQALSPDARKACTDLRDSRVLWESACDRARWRGVFVRSLCVPGMGARKYSRHASR